MKKLLLLAAVVLPLCVSARSYTIDWYKVAGGGGASTGGTYQVSGTIGQPDASGPLTGGNYSVTGGFWALIQAVQSPGAPTLYVTRSGTAVTVFWQNAGSWTLEQNGNLAVSSGWNNSGGVTTSNGTNYLTIPNPSGNQFFKLH